VRSCSRSASLEIASWDPAPCAKASPRDTQSGAPGAQNSRGPWATFGARDDARRGPHLVRFVGSVPAADAGGEGRARGDHVVGGPEPAPGASARPGDGEGAATVAAETLLPPLPDPRARQEPDFRLVLTPRTLVADSSPRPPPSRRAAIRRSARGRRRRSRSATCREASRTR
jgi:hypothetical protein